MTGIKRLFFLLAIGFTLNVHAQYDMDEIFGTVDGSYQPNIHYASWCEDENVVVPTGPTTAEVQQECAKMSRTPICREKWTRHFGSNIVNAYCAAK